MGFSHILRISFLMEKDFICCWVSTSEHRITLVSSVTALFQGLQTQRMKSCSSPRCKSLVLWSLLTRSKKESSCRTGRIKSSFPTWTYKISSLKKEHANKAEILLFGKRYGKNRVPQCTLRYGKEKTLSWKGIALFLLRPALLARRAEQKFPECCWTCVIVSALILSILSFERKPGHVYLFFGELMSPKE